MRRSWMLLVLVAPLFAGCLGSSAALPGNAQPSAAARVKAAKAPHASSVIVVIMENRDYDLVIGSKDAPYINNLLVPQAALMTNSHAITHPSEPNYLGLFSGSTQGVT